MELTIGRAARRVHRLSACGRIPAPYAMAGAAGVAAGACYSSFVLARPLGSRLSLADAYISELETPGQPASTFFRLTDVVAALFIVVLAVALLTRLLPEKRGTAGCLFLAGVGLAAVADALHPMSCTPSTSESCRQHLDRVAVIAQLHDRHTLSSILGVCAAIMAMLLLGDSGRVRRWWPGTARASRAGGLVLAVLAFTEVPLAYLAHGVGAVERLHVLLISAWLIVLGCRCFRPSRARRPEG